MPQLPQCATVLSVSTQAPAQFVKPAWHLSEQFPSEQTSPAWHLLLHEPQRWGSLEVFTQLPSQSCNGDVHSSSHFPSTHDGVPPTALHSSPHPPQLSGSAIKSTHTVPHGVKPASQAKPQRPSAQPGRPCSGAVQVAPQPPQFFESSVSLTHCPPHTVSPLRHDDSVGWQALLATSQA